jgi:protein SCO1
MRNLTLLLVLPAAFGTAFAAPPKAAARLYILRGEIVALTAAQRQVTLRHQEVPGLMPAMTMPFTVEAVGSMKGLRVGDHVEGRLRVTAAKTRLEALRVIRSAQRPPSVSVQLSARLPKPGEPVPAVSLLDQEDRPATVGGPDRRPQVVTFIYTRCPLPDYCPLMTRRFRTLQEDLRRAGLQGRARMCSVTLDPAFDTPTVLSAYGKKAGADFRHWQFLTGKPEAVARLAGSLGEVYAPDRGFVNHNLITAVIDRDGRVTRVFSGNEWRSAHLLAAVRRAIRGGKS